MMNLIQLLTGQQAYEGITHSGGEHNGIGDGDVLVMTKIKDPPLRSPKWTLIWPPDEEQEVAVAPSRETR